MPLQRVGNRTRTQEAGIAAKFLILERIEADLGRPVTLDVLNRGRNVAVDLDIAPHPGAGRFGHLDAIDHQPEELIDAPALLIEDVERLGRDLFQQQLRVGLVVDGDELEEGIALITQAGRCAARGIGLVGNRALRREANAGWNIRRHAIGTGDLAHLEEVGRIVVLQAGEVQQQLTVGGIGVGLLEAGKVGANAMDGASGGGEQCGNKSKKESCPG